MIVVTELAAEKLSAYMTENNVDMPVRVAAVQGCSGPSLGLTLDERKEGDLAQENQSFTLLIDQELSQLCGQVTIDYIQKSSGCGCGGGGFSLTSEKPLPSGGGGCGGSCSSSCGC